MENIVSVLETKLDLASEEQSNLQTELKVQIEFLNESDADRSRIKALNRELETKIYELEDTLDEVNGAKEEYYKERNAKRIRV